MDVSTISEYDDMETRKGEIGSEGLFSPFTFLCFALIVFLMGAMFLYSASFYEAINEGLPHYHFFLNQMIGAAGGLALGSLLCLIPNLALRNIHYVSASAAFALGLVTMAFPDLLAELGLDNFIVLLSNVSLVLFLSDVVARTRKFETIGLPLIWVTLVVLGLSAISAYVGGMGWFILSVVVVLSVLSYQGVKRSWLLFIFLFLSVSGAFILLSSRTQSMEFFTSIMKVDDPSFYSPKLMAAETAVRGGGFFGIGLGKGIFKLGLLEEPQGEFVFATVAEEMGMLGSAILLFSLFIVMVVGVRSSNRALKRDNRFVASMTIGYTSVVVFCALGNILHCIGLNPFPGLVLPFFSYGPFDEALFMVIVCFLYKYIHAMGRGHEKEN